MIGKTDYEERDNARRKKNYAATGNAQPLNGIYDQLNSI